jgi:energy-coupling factor transporter ATP-binding protein EcfA2
MITKITVDGFKSLAGFEIELGQVNVLIGSNGSGKTNILEAIGVLGAAAHGQVDDEALDRRGVRLGRPERYVPAFREITAPEHVAIEAHGDGREGSAAYRVELTNARDMPRPKWTYQAEVLRNREGVLLDRASAPNGRSNTEAGLAAAQLATLPASSLEARLLYELREYAIYTPTTPYLRGTASDPQQREAMGLSGGRLAEAVLALMMEGRNAQGGPSTDGYREGVCAQAMELTDWAHPMYIVSFPTEAGIAAGVPSPRMVLAFKDRYMPEGRDTISAYEASEGALYVAFAAVVAAHPGVSGLVAVDDFDHALNPRLARALIERFCGWVIDNPIPRQVIITTHNPLILDGLDLTDDRIRLFAVGRTSYGRTMAHRVEVDERLLARAKEGWTLSRLWVMGEIGGVPPV